LLRFLTRRQLDDCAWDQCVASAHNALMYGHTWYLDAITNVPGWRWEGLVLANVPGKAPTTYSAVLPIPLRRRWGRWVVYQPLFCQFLALFSEHPVDPTPFIQAVYERYRHVSTWNLLLGAPLCGLPAQVGQRVLFTHSLQLRGSRYAVSPACKYSPDRQMNLRRALRRVANVPDWRVAESADSEPLLTLFRENHAGKIGVGDWAYVLFRTLFNAIQARGLGTLRYAYAGGQVVAGVLFVEQHGRITYLFNAANAEGRWLNARTILLDALIQAEQKKATPMPTLLDFESPEKAGVVSFYESFGAVAQPYIRLSWSRLSWVERLGEKLVSKCQRVLQARV